jgi:RNA polymerase I-specific transcription initiation factor RRN7
VVHDLWAFRLESLASRLELDPLSDSESQMFSSQGSRDATGSSTDDTMTSRLSKASSTPKLLYMVTLCFMGVYLLRLPITVGDFYKWIKDGDMLYYRAIKSVPKHMIDRLPGQYHPFLDPQTTLVTNKLHHSVTETIMQYQKEFEMSIPPMNLALHLFRYVEELALPIDIFLAAKRVGLLASFIYSYPEQKGKKLRIVDFPDGQLVAAIIVSVKMLFPFDSIKRYPRSGGEPTGAVINWDAWENAMKSHADGKRQDERLGWHEAMQVTESDVLTMSDTKIDDYLDYFAKTWTTADPEDKDRDADYRRAMLELFPVLPTQQSPPVSTDSPTLQSQKIKKVIGSLIPRRTVTEEQEEDSGKRVHRPGSLYKRYRKENDVEGHAKKFYQAVADLAGLSLKNVVQAVYTTEARIFQKHEEEELRRQYTARKEGKRRQKPEDEDGGGDEDEMDTD